MAEPRQSPIFQLAQLLRVSGDPIRILADHFFNLLHIIFSEGRCAQNAEDVEQRADKSQQQYGDGQRKMWIDEMTAQKDADEDGGGRG